MALLFCVFIGLGLGTAGSGYSQERAPLPFLPSESMQGVMLGKFLSVYVDPSRELKVDEVYRLYQQGKFLPSPSTMPSYGVTKSIVWAVLTIDNPDKSAKKIVIEQRLQSLSFSLFRRLPDGSFVENRTGFREKNPVGALDYYLPAFELELKPGRHEFLFRTDTLQPSMALLAWDPVAFRQYSQADISLSSGIFAGMVVMALYNFFIFLMARRRENLFYVFYLSGFIVHQLFLGGFGAFVFKTHKNILVDYWALIVAIGTVSILEFTKSFLMLDRARKLSRLMLVMQVYFLFSGLVSLVDMHLSNRMALVPVLFCFSLIIYAGIKRAREGFTPAYYFVAAWACQVLCIVMSILTVLSVLPFHRWSLKALPLGILVEVVMISLAIGEKIRLEREHHSREIEKHSLEIEKHSLEIEKQNQKIQHTLLQMKKVFYPHQVSMIDSGRDLEQTMPTGEALACVICFDIIESSKIRHERTKEFFRDVVRRCDALMLEGYNGDELRSNAYRIKQMGDGFLCSVGYPFKSKGDRIGQDALNLAFQFHKAFQESVRSFGFKDPVSCSIGIAIEGIEASYPEVGTKEYDIFGRGLVLATRYESMRKFLFPASCPASIVVLHDEVYRQLGVKEQAQFMTVDLREEKITVRDDPDADRLHYRLLDDGVRVKALREVG